MRYVALVAGDSKFGAAFAGSVARVAKRYGSWRRVLETPTLQVFAETQERSAFQVRSLGADTLLLGAAFDLPDANLGDRMDAWGGFVALHADPSSARVTIARDPSGRTPCWTSAVPGGTAYASDLEALTWPLAARPPIDWAFIEFHLTGAWIRGARTGLEGVSELLPGETATHQAGGCSRAMGWKPADIAEHPFTSRTEARDALREAAERSVSRWASAYDNIGLQLSGGLDSTIVLGLLGRHAARGGLTAINWVIEQAEGDETRYAQSAADRLGAPLIEHHLRAGDQAFELDRATSLLRPSNKILPLGYDAARRRSAARVGCDALFTGTGGDHVFYNGLPLAAAHDALAQTGFSPDYARECHQLAHMLGVSIWKVMGEGVRRVRTGDRQDPQAQTGNSFLTVQPRDTHAFGHPFAREASQAIPSAKRQHILRLAELQNHYWRDPDLPCDEVHPLVSQPLMEAALRIPSHWFGEGGIQRGLARRAFEDLLPPEVRHRRGKSTNTSHWLQVMLGSLPWIRERLLDGRLVARGLLDRPRLEAALKPLALSASNDLNGLLSSLTTEIWVAAHETTPAGAPASATPLPELAQSPA